LSFSVLGLRKEADVLDENSMLQKIELARDAFESEIVNEVLEEVMALSDVEIIDAIRARGIDPRCVARRAVDRPGRIVNLADATRSLEKENANIVLFPAPGNMKKREAPQRDTSRPRLALQCALLLVAVFMGSVAAVLARGWLQGQAQAVQPVGTIVVAASPMQFGTVISEDKVSEVRWAAEKLPPGAFTTKAEFFKDGRRIALSSMEHDEPVLRNKVTAPGQRGSLSTLIEGGKVAVTVPVDNVRGVAGFIQPNDRVDVVLIRTEGAANGQGYSDLILQNMKVLAIDQIAGQQVEQASIVAKVVTLEATREEAQKLVLAQNIGRLSLILRQPIE
jgi:pilus assembly protein CpaB